MNMVSRCAVIGNPIAQSLSPEIHQAFAGQFNLKLRYEKLLADKENVSILVKRFFHEAGLGLNITSPFKHIAYGLADQVTERAKRSGSVNTLWQRATGELLGDSTDGIGLVRDLQKNKKINLAHKTILIIGAGGVTQSIVNALVNEPVKHITLANRTVSKAERIVDLFQDKVNMLACELDTIPCDTRYDILLHATSLGLSQQTPPLPTALFHPELICYDLSYGQAAKTFLSLVKQQGVTYCYDGLGMLIEQAAEAFFIWHGLKPETSGLSLTCCD